MLNNRIGETMYNNHGSLMTIIEYKNNKNITVEFENGFICFGQYTAFKIGNIKSPYCKVVCGVGYIGEGKYTVKNNNKTSNQYKAWNSMIRRCYSEKSHKTQPRYINCTVCEEWHNFQNFAKWYDENYYEIENKRMELDKDILVKGNKIYSPETCVFVPYFINTLFIKSNAIRGDNPIGVYKTEHGKFRAQCNGFGNSKRGHIGTYETQYEAFLSYKFQKELIIKNAANKYKSKIPNKLYLSMMNYTVDIDD